MNQASSNMRRAELSFRIAAFAIWLYALLVIGQTIWFREHYLDGFVQIVAVVGLLIALGFCAYRGGRLCIVLASLLAGYNWVHRYEYFSWWEWVTVILFLVTVIAGAIGATLYQRLRAREAA